ncbi:MAG: AAA domain-containing protein [Scytonema sp. PMC 1069.18]|nr:AAA domain-containing protein [Scytonema sp. PMC 1069.18]MEC4882595.1 AAA domain-containing protein [Scytonema sp. PMC 1070.18]
MSSFQAEPANFLELLQIVRDGSEISLKPGEYKGPFTIEKSITIRGAGTDTVIFAVDEPAIVIKVPGVRLENLAIVRTVGGDTGEIVIDATKETSPICSSVSLRGIAPNVQWEGGGWDVPEVLDFGNIEPNRQIERSWQVQLGVPCHVVCAVSWLRVHTFRLYPGMQNLQLVLNSKGIPTGTILLGFIVLEAEESVRILRVCAKIKASQSITNVSFQELKKENLDGDYNHSPVVPTQQQLQVWNTFLDIEERIAKSRQFCVKFQSHNYGANTRRVSFEIDVNTATLDGFSENSLAQEDFWQRLKKAQNEDIVLFDSSPQYIRNKREGEKLGAIAEINSENNKICIRLDSDIVERMNRGRYQLPRQGFLYFEAAGDIHQINQKKKALENLRQGHSHNPYLSKFLFNASCARHPSKVIKLQPHDLLKRDANLDQIAAVETVLSSPDLVLIQGPPGTGKTTVIAEICYQVALRGGRTLITSQANLAVDNALSRLVHSPVIRALRKGKAEKVQEEGQPFLEENVIGTWLQSTSKDCEKKLTHKQENIKVLQSLLKPVQRFAKYLKIEEKFQKVYTEFHKERSDLEENYKKEETIYQQTLTSKSEVESLRAGLENLLKTAPHINWEAREVVDFLPRLKAYTEGNSEVESFVANVRTALLQSTKLGFVRPKRGAFGLAVWLQETVGTGIAAFKTISGDLKDAEQGMSEVAATIYVLQQNSEILNQLQTDYQQNLNQQQSLSAKLKEVENRKLEIEFVVTAMKEWKTTAIARIYKIVSDCRQTGTLLTDELLQLPAGLWMIARSLNLPLVSTHYKVNRIDYVPNWVQLNNALSYEIEGEFVNRRGKQQRFSEFLYHTLNQIPLVLSANRRVQWQEVAKQFTNYVNLTKTQRQALIRNTQQFLKQMQQEYGNSWEPQNVESTLNCIARELLENTLTNARECVLPIKIETETQLQYLQRQLKELQKSASIQQQQISAATNQVEVAQQGMNVKQSRVTNLLQKIAQQDNLPKKPRLLIEEYLANPSLIWEKTQEFSTQVQFWETRTSQLENLIASLEPFSVLQIIQNCLEQQLIRLEAEHENAKHQLAEFQIKRSQLENQTEPQPPQNLLNERKWWEQAYLEIPEQFKPSLPIDKVDLCSLEFLHQIKTQFQSWAEELEQDKNYLQRYQVFVQDWIAKLRTPSAQDRKELQQIYIDNANVIGITCVQAARGDFSKEFPGFDVVIVDEVSKCTPPELLIPALKGRKIVLVGDHRQLPPLMNEETIEDIAEELKMTKKELSFIKESLFKIQFESAAPSIKQMLTIQYRMHPQIMGAINQFYQHRLTCGILAPDIQRAHHLAGKIIQEHHHILWVKTPIEQGFAEQREGTSRCNVREVDIIEKLCEQMEAVWSVKVAEGHPQKEIGIITFYSAQLRLIKDRIETNRFPSLSIRTGTVDIFQGMERPVIIVSTVCNNSRRDIGFSKEPERLNVACSRAQELLVVVGCHDLFTHQVGKVGNMYQEVSKVVRRYDGFVDASTVLE